MNTKLLSEIKRRGKNLREQTIIGIVDNVYTNAKYNVKVKDNPAFRIETYYNDIFDFSVVEKIYEDRYVHAYVVRNVLDFNAFQGGGSRELIIVHKFFVDYKKFLREMQFSCTYNIFQNAHKKKIVVYIFKSGTTLTSWVKENVFYGTERPLEDFIESNPGYNFVSSCNIESDITPEYVREKMNEKYEVNWSVKT